MTAIEGLPEGTIGIAFLSGRSCHIINPTAIRAIKTKAGMKSFFKPKVTVISFEVSGFFLGTILFVVGIPFSNLDNSESTSSAL